MSSSRKLLALVVTFVMVFSLMAPAFAATPTDVVGTNYEESVGKLAALGVIAGYEDGTFKPEQNITRAEFAKIAVYALGMQTAADLSKGATKFKDVATDHWATGFINIASDKGLVKGYPDRTFKPEAKVTYAEAITILVRALGMGPVVEGKGTWPANYLAEAAKAGVTDDVTGLSGNAPAIRGNIAIMSWNTITAQVWGEKEYTADGIVYGPLTNANGTKKTLLSQGYRDFVDANGNMKFYEDVEVTNSTLFGNDVDTDEMVVKYTDLPNALNKTAYADFITATKAASEQDDYVKLEVNVPGLDINALVGKYVDVMLDKDNKVVYVKESKTKTITGLVDEFKKAEGKLEVGGIEYTAPSTVTVNGLPMSFANACDTIDDSKAMAVVIKDDNNAIKAIKLLVADAIDADEAPGAKMSDIANALRAGASFSVAQGVVKEIKNDKVYDINDNVIFDIGDVTDEDGNKDNVAVIVKNNKPATTSDIKAGDVITYTKSTLFSANVVNWIMVTDSKQSASLSKISGDNNAADSSARYALTVGSNKIEMVNDGSARISRSGDLEDVEAVTSSITDFYNKEATLYLNALGEIILVSGTVSASATGEIGVVSKDMWEGNPNSNGDTDYYVQILTANGDKKAYVVKDELYMIADQATLSAATEKEVNDVAADGLKAGDVVRYTVNSDGSISGKNLYKLGSTAFEDDAKDIGIKVQYVADANTNKDAKVITIGGTSYFVNSSTVFFNRNTGPDLLDILSGWDNLSDSLDAGGVAVSEPYIIYDKNNMVKAIIFNLNDTSSIAGSDKFGIFVEKYSTPDDDYVTLNVGGENVTYVVATDVYSKVAAGDFVKFELNSNGKFTGCTNADAVANNALLVDKSYVLDLNDTTAYEVDKVNAADRIITLEDGRSYKLDDNVVIYDARTDSYKTVSISDITAGQLVGIPTADTNTDGFLDIDTDSDGMIEFLVIVK